MAHLILDFGGSAVKCAVMTKNAEILKQFSLPSQARSYGEWLDSFESSFKTCNQQFGIEGIAISTCGAVDVETGIIHGASALPYIHGIDVKSLYEERFGVPTEVENDACCAALAESWLGTGKSSNHFCLVVIGTGVGGAIVTEQQVMKGHHLHGGEFGYTIIAHQGQTPQIFGHLASTSVLVEMVSAEVGIPVDELNGVKVFELYDSHDARVVTAVDKWVGYLATGLFNIQYSVDPEVIILGGAISRRHDLLELINNKLDGMLAAIPAAHIRPNLKTSNFGNDANLIGALKHYLNRKGYKND